MALERNITVDQLPRSDLVKILKYFSDYDGVFFLFLSSSHSTASEDMPQSESEYTDEFLIKWADHQKDFFEAGEKLCNLKHIFDVTLSCGEYNFATNKLILSVCSSYFR